MASWKDPFLVLVARLILVVVDFCPIWVDSHVCNRVEILKVNYKRNIILYDIGYTILFGLYMEYLGPSMTPPASHVIPKIEIFSLRNGVDSKYA